MDIDSVSTNLQYISAFVMDIIVAACAMASMFLIIHSILLYRRNKKNPKIAPMDKAIIELILSMLLAMIAFFAYNKQLGFN